MKEESKKTADKDPTNVHVLPIRSKGKTAPVEPEGPSADFESLSKRLEEKIDKIEGEMRNSIQFLEDELIGAIQAKKLTAAEKHLKGDLENLSKQLEVRIQKTLKSLEEGEKNKKDKRHLESIRKLTAQTVKILSFDFYKSVIDRLGNAEIEEEVDPFGMDRHLVQKIKPLFDYLYYRYWRVTTTGIENIPNDGRALIVSNHSGTVPYDGAMIKTAILNEHEHRKDARFLVENFVFHMPVMGTFMYRIGGVRACPENAEFLLKSGHLVIVFPEGVKGIGKFYRQRYKLQRFGRGGFIKLCMRTDSPLIPVGIVGAEEIHPILFKSNVLAKTIGLPYIPITPTFPLLGPLGLVPLPTKWSIHFGEPIHFKEHGEKAAEDELLVHRLSEKVRSQIQEIVFDLLKRRRSVWTG